MTESTQIREIILEVLLQINRDGEHSHLAIRHALDTLHSPCDPEQPNLHLSPRLISCDGPPSPWSWSTM